MIDKVKKIAKNPIAHVNEQDKIDFFALEKEDEKQMW
jgi:hypothetical protein